MSYRSDLEARLAKKTTRAIVEYDMLENGDRVLVGLSGGKDSWALLQILDVLRQRAPIRFTLVAVNVGSEVKEALRGAGILGLTASEVQGYGRQGGKTETFRGSEYKVDFVPKVKVEVLVEGTQVDKVIDLIAISARTGKIGDGKIWAYDLDRVMRIRTGELGDEAV